MKKTAEQKAHGKACKELAGALEWVDGKGRDEYQKTAAEYKGWKLELIRDTDYGFEQYLDMDNAVNHLFWGRGLDSFVPSMHDKDLSFKGMDYAEMREFLDGPAVEAWEQVSTDRGQDCYIFLTPEARRKEWGRSKKAGAKYLVIAAKEARKVADGDVWGFVVTGPDGIEGDSCWGFVGKEWAESEGISALVSAMEYETKKRAKVAACTAL